MRIALATTYPPKICGIGTYSRALAMALAELPDVQVGILGEAGGMEEMDGPVDARVAFQRKGQYGPAVFDAAQEWGADLVHFQHSPDIFGVDDRLPALAMRLRSQGIGVVTTLHTVYSRLTGLIERKLRVRRFHRRLGEASDRLIVHQQRGMEDELIRQGIPKNRIEIIPHGTGQHHLPDQAESRRELGLPEDGPLLLYFGFIHVQKNLHTAVRALARLRSHVPNARLMVAGTIQYKTWYNRLYLTFIHWQVKRKNVEDAVVFRSDYVPDEMMPRLYAASDIVLLPYNQGYGSASGMVHNALAAHRPMVCSRSPKFYEVAESLDPGLTVSTHSSKAWANKLLELLTRPESLSQLQDRIVKRATETSWSAVAEQHAKVYASVLSEGSS